MAKKDYLLAIISGVITAFFVLPILKNISVSLPFSPTILFLIFPLLMTSLIFFASFFKNWLFVRQFSKFLVTGFFNTAIDFGILNMMSMKFGIYSGLRILGINPISFLVAAANSFFWNKHWTFEQRGGLKIKEIIEFLIVVGLGVILNTVIVILIIKIIPPLSFLTEGRLLNLAKASATAITLIWNFLGLKIFVFRKKESAA